jgi:hypothetical protein
MSKKIVFKINKEGNVVIDKVEGYGSSCMDATKLIERRIGLSDESSRSMTDEYLEPAETAAEEHIHL